MRYQQKMTLKATGEKLGVTEERVRQIQAKAVARLKHPYRSRFLLAGMKCLRDSFTLNRQMQSMCEGMSCRMSRIEGMLRDQFGEQDGKSKRESHTSFDTLELSVRPYNCLHRAGIFTVEDILALPNLFALRHINNLSVRGYEEILQKLEDHGYDISNLSQGDTADISDVGIEELDLSTRSYNCLRREKLYTIHDILALPNPEALNSIRHLGAGSRAEILSRLQELGCDVSHLMM